MNADRTDEFDDGPMTEAEWEQAMRESDVRSARYGELLETLIDHPDRDAIISREMGWDRDDDDDGGEEPEPSEPIAVEPPTQEELDAVQRQHDAVEEIPAFARSREWAMTVWNALEKVEADEGSDLEELLGEAIGGSMSVSVKIAGGHGMGYDDAALCGNIVRCKRSLEAADESLRALEEMRDNGFAVAEVVDPLLEEGRQIRKLVEAWIEELRERVWWE